VVEQAISGESRINKDYVPGHFIWPVLK